MKKRGGTIKVPTGSTVVVLIGAAGLDGFCGWVCGGCGGTRGGGSFNSICVAPYLQHQPDIEESYIENDTGKAGNC